MKRFFLISLFIFLIVVILTGCVSSPSTKDSSKELTIYTSIYPIQYIVEQIGRDIIDVHSIYPSGVDAHTYEPTSREITSIASGDAFIYLGAGMEGFAETAAEALKTQDVAFIELGKHSNLFDKGEKEEDGHVDHGDVDPHIWLDPLRMIKMADIIKSELIQLNPNNKTIYEENFSKLKSNMMNLDETYKETLLDKDNKEIIVSHAAYGYWEKRYGIKQIAISGLSSGDEPSQKELAKIAKLAESKNSKYVIFEYNSSDRVSTIIQEHIAAEALYIHNLETLTDEDIKNNEDYLSLMQANLDVLDQAVK